MMGLALFCVYKVNEDFEGEADVERAATQQQKISITSAILKLLEDRETAVYYW